MLWAVHPYDQPKEISEAVRKAFAKQCLSELKAVSRGSGWQKRENVLFRKLDQWFVAAEMRIASNRLSSWLEFRIKPLPLDPLLWRITKVDHARWPLSAREFYFASCRTPEVRELAWGDAGLSPRDNVERAMVELDAVPAMAKSLGSESFADFIEKADDHGDYTVAQAISLILEGREEEALILSQDCVEGRRKARWRPHVVSEPGGRSRNVHELISEWIRSGPHDTREIDGDSA